MSVVKAPGHSVVELTPSDDITPQEFVQVWGPHLLKVGVLTGLERLRRNAVLIAAGVLGGYAIAKVAETAMSRAPMSTTEAEG